MHIVFTSISLFYFLQTNVEELSQYVAFLEPWKNLVMHGQDEGTQVAELQRRLSGRVC
jgi:hypothetical protein